MQGRLIFDAAQQVEGGDECLSRNAGIVTDETWLRCAKSSRPCINIF